MVYEIKKIILYRFSTGNDHMHVHVFPWLLCGLSLDTFLAAELIGHSRILEVCFTNVNRIRKDIWEGLHDLILGVLIHAELGNCFSFGRSIQSSMKYWVHFRDLKSFHYCCIVV